MKDRRDYARQMRDNPTTAEYYLSQLISDFNEKQKTRFYRQVLIQGYIVDFYFPEARLAIEVDGPSHVGKEKYDDERQQRLINYGIDILRFTNEKIMEASYYAKWSERQQSKQVLDKHEKASQLRCDIRESIRDLIDKRVIEWSVE